MCIYTCVHIYGYVCVRITNPYICKKRLMKRMTLCDQFFLFLAFVFSFTVKILFCKVIYISSSLV